MYDPQKTTWLNPNIEYLFNTEINEYDIRDAGFSLIQQYKLLPPEKIAELRSYKVGADRHIAVGKLMRDDKEFAKRLTEKFAEIRTVFVFTNHLTDDQILSVKKDAFFIIGTVERTQFGTVEFRKKHSYSAYLRLNKLELYYSEESGLEIKGMSEISMNRHRMFLIQVLEKVIKGINAQDQRIKRYLISLLHQYKQRELPEEYALEFNNLSKKIDPAYNYQRVFVPLIQIMHKELDA